MVRDVDSRDRGTSPHSHRGRAATPPKFGTAFSLPAQDAATGVTAAGTGAMGDDYIRADRLSEAESVIPPFMANGQPIQLLPIDAPLRHELIHERDEAGAMR